MTPVFSHDGSTLLTKHEDILQHWADHFNLVLNRPSVVDDMVLDDIPQLLCDDHVAMSPHVDEVSDAIQQMSSIKACGLDDLPAEIFKHGGRILVEILTQLYSLIWQHEAVHKDFKDATIIHLCKTYVANHLYLLLENHGSYYFEQITQTCL